MIRLLIADDHTLVRKGLKQIFDDTEDIRVVAEASDGGQVQELLRQELIDVLVLDVSMPGLSGADLILRIHNRYPELPILVLSMFNEVQIAKRKLQAGASGYLTKDCDPETLVSAIRKVAQGGRAISPELAERIAFDSTPPPIIGIPTRLTLRESQILNMMAEGLSLNAIADKLVISPKTVSTHKIRLMKKLSIDNNADLIRFALTQGEHEEE